MHSSALAVSGNDGDMARLYAVGGILTGPTLWTVISTLSLLLLLSVSAWSTATMLTELLRVPPAVPEFTCALMIKVALAPLASLSSFHSPDPLL